MYLRVRSIDLSVSMIFLVDFGTVPTEWYIFFFFHFICNNRKSNYILVTIYSCSVQSGAPESNSCSARGTGCVTLLKFSISIQNNLLKTYSYIIIVDKLRSIQE